MKGRRIRTAIILMAGIVALSAAACGERRTSVENIIEDEGEEKKLVSLFAPMERTKPDARNAARTAFDKTVIMAEEQLGLKVEYNTYTAEDYQDKSYDDVATDRIWNDMDDLYQLNPDVTQKAGRDRKSVV